LHTIFAMHCRYMFVLTMGLLSCICTLQEQQSVEDVLAAANALLNNLQSGEPMPSTPGVQASIDELQGMGYVCDESGCVLVFEGDQREDSKSPLVGGVAVWLAGHAHLSCLDLRQWITIGVDIHSFIWFSK
jgi:hypothetical protein